MPRDLDDYLASEITEVATYLEWESTERTDAIARDGLDSMVRAREDEDQQIASGPKVLGRPQG